MKLETLLFAWALALALPLGAAEPKLDAPTGLTLQAREGGRYQLLWDPIDRDDLLGYSVWLRKPGEREFTRLNVPVKVGKEVRKMPLTGEARLVLALGAARRDVEVTVLAEYESGASERAPSAFTRLAQQPAAAAPKLQGQPVAATEPATPAEEKAAEERSDFQRPLPGAEKPLITPRGAFRSELGFEWDFNRSIRKGRDEFWTLGLIGTGIPYEKVVEWEIIEVRTIFSVPLTLRWGVMPGFELWGQARYNAEDVYTGAYDIDGESFNYITPVRWVDDRYVELSKPSSTGLGDSKVGVRVQPFDAAPVVLGATLHAPTGSSRFKAYLDWDSGRSFPAGTGQGVQRMEFNVEWGRPGAVQGLSLRGSYSPGAVERVRAEFFGFELDHVLSHGDRFELGGAYTFPWKIRGMNGSLLPGIVFRTLSPARWTIEGIEIYPLYPPYDQARIVAHLQERFVRDDQLELVLEAVQDLPSGFRTGGRFSYVTGVQGDALRLSGQLYY